MAQQEDVKAITSKKCQGRESKRKETRHLAIEKQVSSGRLFPLYVHESGFPSFDQGCTTTYRLALRA